MANFVSIKEAAKRLGITPRTLYNLKYKGEIEHHYLGSGVRIDLDEVYAKIILTTTKPKEDEPAIG